MVCINPYLGVNRTVLSAPFLLWKFSFVQAFNVNVVYQVVFICCPQMLVLHLSPRPKVQKRVFQEVKLPQKKRLHQQLRPMRLVKAEPIGFCTVFDTFIHFKDFMDDSLKHIIFLYLFY